MCRTDDKLLASPFERAHLPPHAIGNSQVPVIDPQRVASFGSERIRITFLLVGNLPVGSVGALAATLLSLKGQLQKFGLGRLTNAMKYFEALYEPRGLLVGAR